MNTTFLLMATVTVLSPGPGVVMTLTNALSTGLRGTLGGILGIATGTLVVAAVSATGLGVLLATSQLAFIVLKYLGAAYLVYLGLRLWLSPASRFEIKAMDNVSMRTRFVEGISLQLTNPKAVLFFLSVFPQFIEVEGSYLKQFTALVLTYDALVIVIHGSYAMFAKRAKTWLLTARGGKNVQRVAGTMFVLFGAMLATAKQ